MVKRNRTEYARNYYRRNKEKIRTQPNRSKEARHLEYLKRKEKVASYEFKKRYGITMEERNLIILSQEDRCAICKSNFLNSRDIHIDHNHLTGKIRGILCRACNHLIGNCKEDSRILEAAILYLSLHKGGEQNGV